MARKNVKARSVKKTTPSTIPTIETDFLVLIIVAVACFVLLGVVGYFLK